MSAYSPAQHHSAGRGLQTKDHSRISVVQSHLDTNSNKVMPTDQPLHLTPDILSLAGNKKNINSRHTLKNNATNADSFLHLLIC